MPIRESRRPVASARLAAIARELLDASPLCAIATVTPRGRAHVSTAYFAWSRELDLVWLSGPQATHSRNVRANPTAAISVYDSRQSWGEPDRGIQLFGSARELEGVAAQKWETLYAERFPDYGRIALGAYRFYRLRPDRLKLFDERALGAGVFVTAAVAGGGRLTWRRTEIHGSKHK
jgi:uncharacterized protein YhbP (UPF0306 family)